VEDDELNRKLVRSTLARSANSAVRGALLLEAGTLAEARAQLAADSVGIVILDLTLPDGDGRALLSELGLTPGQTPVVIAVTGGGDQARGEALAAGCTAVLAKPYHAVALDDLLGDLLAADPRAAGEPAGADMPGTGEVALDFRALFEATSGPYLVLTPDLTVVAASGDYVRRTGLRWPGSLGQSVLTALPAEGADAGRNAELHASLDRVRHTRRQDAMHVQSHPAGSAELASSGGIGVRYLSPVSTPVTGPAGELSCIIHQLRDVTDYVRLSQEQMSELDRRSRQIAATTAATPGQALPEPDGVGGQFVERLGHELRAPLNTIIGFGELLGLDELSASHREWVSMMLTAARHLVQLLDESLDVTRIGAGGLSLSAEAVPLLSAITDATEIMRPLAIARGVRLDPLPTGAASDYAYADGQRLRQVLLNLLSNAIKFNYPAGNVAVTVSRQGQERIRISVVDTGRGVAAADIERLFQPFERLDAAQAGIEGTGLGLALSRDLVVAMGGTAGVSSTPGGGSEFWIELPRTEPMAVSQLAIGPAAIAASREYSAPRTVLYVEDMVENLRLVEQILRQRPSVTVIPAMLAGVALDLARQHHPDMILLDLHMPDMPGEDFLAALRSDPAIAGIPVVILTADISASAADLITAYNAAAYLAKPIGVRDLLETVDKLLAGPAADLEAAASQPAEEPGTDDPDE